MGLEAQSETLEAFQKDLETLVNQYSIESLSGTPDFVIAQFLTNQLVWFSVAINEREKWYGRPQDRFGMPA